MPTLTISARYGRYAPSVHNFLELGQAWDRSHNHSRLSLRESSENTSSRVAIRYFRGAKGDYGRLLTNFRGRF